MIVETVETTEEIEPDVVPDLLTFFVEGRKYILDPKTLVTQEDVINVIKHFSSRVELHVFQIKGIEKYVKPLESTNIH